MKCSGVLISNAPFYPSAMDPLIMCQTFWKDSQHTLWQEREVKEWLLGEARGREIPVCFPLTKMSKTAAEEMSAAGDPSGVTIL